jgi:DNA (cytosine-5)-methyltransferase 1
VRADSHPERRDTSGQRGADPESGRRGPREAARSGNRHRGAGRPDVHVAGDDSAHRGLTHASFFSGVGGLDLGLERAGWRTVSFSEVDPYASAVLAARWPGVPNLGDITRLAGSGRLEPAGDGRVVEAAGNGALGARSEYRMATLWSGGFPCQGLSVAGKRRGLADERSGLAFAFLDLVGRHRPSWVLLENVPGLLSSHAGRDLGALLGALGELGYGWAYRVLDARHFGVPQRRRRVFILAHTVDGHPDADGPAAVLAVGTRCRRHPPTGIETGEEPAPGARAGVDIARAVTGTSWKRHDDDTDTLVPLYNAYSQRDRVYNDLAPALDAYGDTGSDSPIVRVDRPPPDADRVRAPDGLAGRVDGGDGLAATLNSNRQGGFRLDADTAENLVIGRADGAGEPDGLDSHRYRCCGNGVVSSVAEWIGLRLASHIA